MNKLHLTLLSIFFTLGAMAQEVMVEETYTPIDTEEIDGPNTKTFSHFYTSVAFFIDQPQGNYIDLTYGRSNQYTLGYRYKIKVNNVFSIFADAALCRSKISYKYNLDYYSIEPIQTKIQFVRFYNTQLAPGFRINFDPHRGNFLGLYLDVAAYMGYSFSTTMVAKYEDLDNSAKSVVVRYNNLSFVNDINYGIKTRIGYNKYALVAQYRISDLITNNLRLPELSRISVGFEYGFVGK